MQLYSGEEKPFFSPQVTFPLWKSIPQRKAFSQKAATQRRSKVLPGRMKSLKKKNYHFGLRECPGPDGTSSQGKQIVPKHRQGAQTGAIAAFFLSPHKILQTSAGQT